MLRAFAAALFSATRYIFAFPLVVGELFIAPFRWMAMAAMPGPASALEAVGASAALAVSSDDVLDAEAEQRRREREARRAQAYGMPTAHASVTAGPAAQAATEQVARRPRTRQPAQPHPAVIQEQARLQEKLAQHPIGFRIFLYARAKQSGSVEEPDLSNFSPELRAWLMARTENELFALNRTSAALIERHVLAEHPKERLPWLPAAPNPEIEARRSAKAAAVREALASVGIEVDDETAEKIMDRYGSGPRPAPDPGLGM